MTNAADEITNVSLSKPRAVSSTSSLDSFAGVQVQNTGTTASTQSSTDYGTNLTASIPVGQHGADQSSRQTILSLPTAGNTASGHGASVSINPGRGISSSASVVSQGSTSLPVPIMPSLSVASVQTSSGAQANNTNTVAEFLYQLTKMLTEDNREVIEWSKGRIEVHNPHRLASEVLHKYFRHSKFASFQRQLNYFGFRKFAGKGKMAPCSYVNDAATSDLRSILLIKRKTSAMTAKEKNSKKRDRNGSRDTTSVVTNPAPPVNPVLAGILQRSTVVPDVKRPKTSSMVSPKLTIGKGVKHDLSAFVKLPSTPGTASNNSHLALAQTAVGKGVRHRFSSGSQPPASSGSAIKETLTGTATLALSSVATAAFTFKDPHQLGMDIQSSLSELSNNFRNSLNDAKPETATDGTNKPPYYGMLSRDDSLVDLAMIPQIENSGNAECDPSSSALAFVDFPQHDDFDETKNLGGS